MYKDAKRRAEDAQRAFVAMLMTDASRTELAEGLSSVFSTHEAMFSRFEPGRAAHGHKSFKDKPEHEFFFRTLEAQVWRMKTGRLSSAVICEYICSACSSKNIEVFKVVTGVPNKMTQSAIRPTVVA